MAKDRNCPNCGAVIEYDKNKCPYCGTAYYDLTVLDLEHYQPFFLKCRTEQGTLLVKVFVSHVEANVSPADTLYYADGTPVFIVPKRDVEIVITLNSVI